MNLTAGWVVLMSLVSMLAGAGALAATDLPRGKPPRGAALFQQCAACHSIERGVHVTGPSLADIWDRPAATAEGFGRYSTALKRSGITWTERTLDRWIERPEALVHDAAVTFQGVSDRQQRADLIAYLKVVAEGKAPPAPGGGMMGAGSKDDLKQTRQERPVVAIRYCGDAYHVTSATGRTVPFWENNLRFKTESSPKGSEPGKPVLVPVGMMGDRTSIVFARPEEISRALERKCPDESRSDRSAVPPRGQGSMRISTQDRQISWLFDWLQESARVERESKRLSQS